VKQIPFFDTKDFYVRKKPKKYDFIYVADGSFHKNHKNLFFGNVDKNLGYEVRANTKKQIIDLVKEKNKKKISNMPNKSLAYLRNNYYILPQNC
jgi:hypothetical protein